MTRRFLLASVLVAVTSLAAVAACEDGSPAIPCVNSIPNGGCPAVSGVDVCGDPHCPSVYSCTNGKYVLDQTCNHAAQDGSVDGADARGEAGIPPDAAIDAPPGAFGGPGCVALQTPECAAGTALECGGAQDCCGCADLFVCVDGGWNPWGQCIDGGVIPQ